MKIDEEMNNEGLGAAIATLKEPPTVSGLAGRVQARRTTLRRRRNWLSSSAGVLGTIAITLVLTQRSGQLPGEVTFALIGPANAAGISLVGDFNDWDSERTHLERHGSDEWRVTLQLDPGRYRFAYVTDEGDWLADPDAPPTLDEFGEPTSVITVTTQ
jgi:1,4-alpha-glucan branching enzyme